MSELPSVRKNPLFYPIAAGVLGNVIWGFSYLFTRIAQRSAPPMVQLSIRFLLAFALMNLLLLTGREKLSLRGKRLAPLLLLSVTEPLYFFCESYGIYYTNSTFAGVTLAIVPVVSLLLAIPILREYPTGRQVAFSFLPILGVVLITLADRAAGVIRPLGVALLIGACLLAALYRIANRGSSAEFTAFERAYAVIGTCCLVFTAIACITVRGDLGVYWSVLHSRPFLFSTLALSIFCSVAANLLVNYAASSLPVVTISNLGSIITICAMFVGVIFLHEPISPLSLFGSLLVLAGIWLVTRSTTPSHR